MELHRAAQAGAGQPGPQARDPRGAIHQPRPQRGEHRGHDDSLLIPSSFVGDCQSGGGLLGQVLLLGLRVPRALSSLGQGAHRGAGCPGPRPLSRPGDRRHVRPLQLRGHQQRGRDKPGAQPQCSV
mgnify:CR=1 FL=1